MKKLKWLWIISLSVLMLECVYASPLDEIAELLPEEAENVIDGLQEDLLPHEIFLQGMKTVGVQAVEKLGRAIKAPLGGIVALLGIVLLCALAEDCFRAFSGKGMLGAVTLAGALAITLVSVNDMNWLLGKSIETIDSLHALSTALLPVLSAAVAAGGGIVSAGVRQVAGVVFADLLITMIHQLLLPMVYVQVAASAADAMFPRQSLRAVARLISKVSTWVLTGMVAVYTGYLTLIGALSSSADRMALQLAHSALGAVPVVGGIIADAAGTVVAGAAMMKNSIGVVGMLAALAVCLVPFMELTVQYVLYKLAALLAGTMGSSRLTELIDELGSAFGVILGMTGTCALLVLISFILSVTVVSA